MSGFLDPLILTPTDDGEHWILEKAFDYWTDSKVDNLRIQIEVPADFVTDLASIPRVFWNILPPFGRYTRASVLHDWLYHTQQFCRKWSDDILMEAMQVLGVPWLTRWTIYCGVRAGGWVAWNEHTKQNAKAAVNPI